MNTLEKICFEPDNRTINLRRFVIKVSNLESFDNSMKNELFEKIVEYVFNSSNTSWSDFLFIVGIIEKDNKNAYFYFCIKQEKKNLSIRPGRISEKIVENIETYFKNTICEVYKGSQIDLFNSFIEICTTKKFEKISNFLKNMEYFFLK